jgi:hypothetical protein
MSDVSTKAPMATAGAVLGSAEVERPRASDLRSASFSIPPHTYFDTPAAARRLGVSPRTLVDYRSRGGGPKWVRIARAVRYRADWLDQWADDKAVTSTSQETALVTLSISPAP